MSGSTGRRWTAIGLMMTGLVLLGWFTVDRIEMRAYQREGRATLERASAKTEPPQPGFPAIPPPVLGSVLGSLEIPRLKFSVVAVEGDDDKYLKRGVGHLHDTPLPWESGNTAFAGHRDTHFRPLKDIAVGDEIRIKTLHGEFKYHVSSTRIVTPNDVSVLDQTSDATLTLITCYPFNFVGHAPKRFIIKATLGNGSEGFGKVRRGSERF